jgi:SAM-dependent methyltransferase
MSAKKRKLLILAIGILVSGAAIGAWLLGNRYLGQTQSLGKVSDRIGKNAPFIKTPDPIVDRMIEMADLKEGDLAYDLGCGDGRIIITAALKKKCRGIGFDIDPQRIAEARANAKQQGVDHLVEFRQQDIFTVDLDEADAVLMYLLPWMTRKLIPQLRELKPGARIVSHQFHLGDEPELKPERTDLLPVEGDANNHFIHRWTAPLEGIKQRRQENELEPLPNVR